MMTHADVAALWGTVLVLILVGALFFLLLERWRNVDSVVRWGCITDGLLLSAASILRTYAFISGHRHDAWWLVAAEMMFYPLLVMALVLAFGVVVTPRDN